MSKKVLAIAFGTLCGASLAILAVVSCQTVSNPPDLSAAVGNDLSGAAGRPLPPPCGGIVPCKPVGLIDLSAPAFDLAQIYACCWNSKSNCGDCDTGSAVACSACKLLVSSKPMCSIECPKPSDMVGTAPAHFADLAGATIPVNADMSVVPDLAILYTLCAVIAQNPLSSRCVDCATRVTTNCYMCAAKTGTSDGTCPQDMSTAIP